ncbi:hypothetical protein OH492_04310 [Vibrio chagasii]|nr:hypothetical protein [Vibrio chagasii]
MVGEIRDFKSARSPSKHAGFVLGRFPAAPIPTLRRETVYPTRSYGD